MPASGSVVRIVAADPNILINFIHVQRLDLLGHLPEYEFVMPEEVRGEITDPNQEAAVREAIDAGILRLVAIEDVPTLTLFAELTGLMGRGEAACLSLAVTQNWLIASDEKRTFRREALARLGNGRLINTPGLLVLSIRAGLITIEEADAMKELLEQRRFRMKVRSFRDLL
jgi:predicted nucleic acid-binding protein